MRLTSSNYDTYKAYESIEEAIEAYEDEYGEDAYQKNDGICNCSLAIGIDENNKYWFAVGSLNVFTSCTKEDLTNWKNWFDEEWVEYEEFDRFGISFYYPKTPDKSTTNEDYTYKSEEEACFRAVCERKSLTEFDEEVVIEVGKIKFRWGFLSDRIEEIDDTYELVETF